VFFLLCGKLLKIVSIIQSKPFTNRLLLMSLVQFRFSKGFASVLGPACSVDAIS